MTRLYFTAGEPSGDVFGAEVVDAIKRANSSVSIRSAGGKALSACTQAAPIDLSPMDVLGLWEGLLAYGDVQRISSQIADDILDFKPEAAILVDSWGLSLRVAKKVRAKNPSIRLLKLVGPQVWATRPGRAKTLAAYVDHLMCLHHFEVPFYEPHGLDVTVVGQPALARQTRLSGDAFRARRGISEDEPMVLMLPGSRSAEISRVAPVLMDAAKALSVTRPDLKVCIAPASNVRDEFQDLFRDLPQGWDLLEDDSERFEAMAAATLSLCCSGTVTTELAVQGTPFITGYRIGHISWALIRYVLMKARFITLLNVAADKMVAPEYLQNAFNAESLVSAASRLLDNPEQLARQKAEQEAALVKMGYGGEAAPEIAARTILNLLT